MLPHQQRLVAEAQDLGNKLTNLVAFIEADTFAAVPAEEQLLLCQQASHMGCYLSILGQRIALFAPAPDASSTKS